MATVFQLDVTGENIAILTFDHPGQRVNTFSARAMKELTQITSDLEERSDIRGLILRSNKPGQFSAGADLAELRSLSNPIGDAITTSIEAGHSLFTRVSNLPFPTVAAIDGHCMGGGTELSLCLDFRLLSDSPRAGMALPEIKIGIIPGWGGTQRLPRLVGINHAIKMISSGATVRGAEAVETGLVFDVVPAEQLLSEAKRLIEMAHSDGIWNKDRMQRRQPLGMTADQIEFTFSVAEGYIRGKTGPHYPAPLVATGVIRAGINLPLREALGIERKAAIEIIQTQTANNLIQVFFKKNAVERDPGIDLQEVLPRDVSRVGVLGTGLMGAGIATAHARRDIATAMVDVNDDRIAAGMHAAARVVQGRIRAGRATENDLADMMGKLSTSTSHQIFSDCDVVIEAVPEDEALKTSVYASLAKVMREDAILASNTSTISITRMADAAPAADRFVGMHFFSPVDRMELVEVIRGELTSDETVATTVALAKQIGKTPIVVNDCPGFLVNRVLMPYMAEAVQLLCEGATMDAIDRAATKFGMPVGPFALHDMVGIDVSHFAGQVLVNAYADRAVRSDLLKHMVDAGRLGKKSGKGFRQYVGRKSKPAADPTFESFLAACRTDNRNISTNEITERLFLTMLLEAVRALDDNIVQAPVHVDIAMILGTGFPAFRGGLMGWCDNEGADTITEMAARYESLGKRFEAPETLQRMAGAGESFYVTEATPASVGV